MRTYSLSELLRITDAYKASGRTVGLCHGCFDVLHTGHIRHLEAAASLCDYLFVSVTADRAVNKGPGRPVFSARERADILNSLRVVSGTIINEAKDSTGLLKALRPTFYFKGQEYLENPASVNANFLVERNVAVGLGIKVRYTFEEVDSSSAIIARIVDVLPSMA